MTIVFSGIFAAGETEGDFAAVLGYENAHTVAHHAEAGLSPQILFCECFLPACLFKPFPWVIVALIPVWLWPDWPRRNERRNEGEADKIGMLLMTEAGFNPGAATSFWKKMDKVQQQML